MDFSAMHVCTCFGECINVQYCTELFSLRPSVGIRAHGGAVG